MDSHANSVRIHQQVGYLPGDFITYEKLTPLELLESLENQRRDITNATALTLAETEGFIEVAAYLSDFAPSSRSPPRREVK